MRIRHLILGSLLSLPMAGWAAPGTQQLEEAQFVIPKTQHPTVGIQQRYFFAPPTAPPLKSKQPFAYPLPNFSPALSPVDSQVRLRKMVPDLPPPLYHRYLRGGGDLYSEKLQLTGLLSNTFHYKYRYNLYADLDGTRKATLEGDGANQTAYGLGKLYVRYRRREYLMPALLPGQETSNQAFNYVRGKLVFRGEHWEKLPYTLTGRYSFLKNDSKTYLRWGQLREGQGLLALKLAPCSLGGDVTGTLFTDLYLGHHRTAPAPDPKLPPKKAATTTYYQGNRALLRLKPELQVPWQAWRFALGVHGGVHNDKDSDAPLLLAPFLELRQADWDLHPYLRLTGDIYAQGLQQVVNDNCWVHTDQALPLRHTQEKISLQGGVQHRPFPQVFVELGSHYSKYKDMLFFVPDGKLCRLQYDHPLVLHPFGAVRVTNSRQNLTGRLQVKGWWYHRLKELEVPVHRPRYAVELLTTYKLYDKVLMNGSLQWLGGIRVGKGHSLPALLDTGLGIDYFFTNCFVLYTQIKNLFLFKNERYKGQPGKPFQLVLGASYIW